MNSSKGFANPDVKKHRRKGKQKRTFKINHYRASILKNRHPVVESWRRSLLAKAQSSDSKTKKLIIKRLNEVLWFDQPLYRRMLIKLCNSLESLYGRFETKGLVSWYVGLFEYRALTQGTGTALKFFKELYGYACRYCASHETKAIPYTKSNSKGFPLVLKPLGILMKGSYLDRKLSLSVLSLFRAVEYSDRDKPFDPGLIGKTPLNDTSAFTEDNLEVGTYFKEAFSKVKDNLPVDFKINKWIKCYKVTLKRMFPTRFMKSRLDEIKGNSGLHFTGRNGPNGPALLTIMQDFKSLTPELLDFIKEISSITENNQLSKLLDFCSKTSIDIIEQDSNNKKIPIQKDPIHSKISLKEESWGRLRAFAIVDYFSHSALRGFHKYLFDTLETFQEDCTFEQEKGYNAVKLWTVTSDSSESADLSEATNVIPLLVQREIVQSMTNNRFGYLWSNLVSNRVFTTPDKGTIKYTCGQPMGISSSWPMLAMWHHVMARTAISYTGIDWKSKTENPYYYVIGDDICIKDTTIFHIYETAVSILQDVGISKSKGFHSETSTSENILIGFDTNHTAEFAKRIYCNGLELTPIPPDQMFEFFARPYLFPNVVTSLMERDYILQTDQVKYLAEQSNDCQLALDALCVPYQEGSEMDNLPMIKDELKQYTIWDSDDSEELLESLMELIREVAQNAINSAQAELVVWAQKFRNSKIAVRVRTWSILGEAYYYLFQQLSQELAGKYSQKYAEFFGEFEGLTPENWKQFMKSLGNLNTVFDIAEQLERVNSTKPKADKPKLAASILGKAIKQIRKDKST